MKKRKTYNEVFKRKVVIEVLSGSMTKEEARTRYDRIGGNSIILDWMHKYERFKMRTAGLHALPILQTMNTDESKEKLKEKIKQLESKLEYAGLKSRAYQIMVDIAKEQYNLDFEKKFGTKQSKNSKKNNLK